MFYCSYSFRLSLFYLYTLIIYNICSFVKIFIYILLKNLTSHQVYIYNMHHNFTPTNCKYIAIILHIRWYIFGTYFANNAYSVIIWAFLSHYVITLYDKLRYIFCNVIKCTHIIPIIIQFVGIFCQFLAHVSHKNHVVMRQLCQYHTKLLQQNNEI